MIFIVTLLAAILPAREAKPVQEEVVSRFAMSVCGIGDVNTDGSPDFLVGDPGFAGSAFDAHESRHRGRVWLLSGADGSVIWAAASKNLGDGFGRALGRIDDLNGDGAPDCLVGSNEQFGEGPGFVAILCGRTGERIRTVHGERPNDLFGLTVEGLGDVDGDGVADFAASASRRDADGLPDGTGELRSISGATGEVIRRTPCFLWVSFVGGRPATGLGDVNGDGRADFAVRRPNESDRRIYEVVDGANGSVLWSAPEEDDGLRPISSYDWNADGVVDLVLEGNRRVLVRSGDSGSVLARIDHPFDGAYHRPVRVLGDADEDGTPDLAVPNHTQGIAWGCIKALSGADAAEIYHVRGSKRDIDCRWSDWHFGEAVDAIGDLDGDGVQELAVGGMQAGNHRGGTLWILDGATGAYVGVFVRDGDGPVARYGWTSVDRGD